MLSAVPALRKKGGRGLQDGGEQGQKKEEEGRRRKKKEERKLDCAPEVVIEFIAGHIRNRRVIGRAELPATELALAARGRVKGAKTCA
jgi:hypothetical protein